MWKVYSNILAVFSSKKLNTFKLNQINYKLWKSPEISCDNTMLNQDQSDQEENDKANTVRK